MAKIKVTLDATPSFPAVVAIPVPGSDTPDKVEFTFKARTRDEYSEWMKNLPGKTNVEAILEVVEGWKFPFAFTEENVKALDQKYMGAAGAILDKYISEVTQAKLGN
jgi:hypothetical protein